MIAQHHGQEIVALRDFKPAYDRSGSFTSFPPSPHVRLAPKSGHSANACVYEYTPFCNGPGDVKSPRVMSRRRAHASVRGRRRGRHTMLSEGTVSLSRYAWFVG